VYVDLVGLGNPKGRQTMKHITVQATEDTVQIPGDAEAWYLYSDMKGVGRAARALTAALKRALKAPNRDKAIAIMREAMSKYSAFGAADTEPCVEAERALTNGRGGSYRWTL
jgi:hypothetical protein